MSKCVRKSRSLWNSCPISWQWNRRTITCQFALSLVNNQELFELPFWIITGDETLVCGYRSETNQMSSQWQTASSSLPKKVQQVKSNSKPCWLCFSVLMGRVLEGRVWLMNSIKQSCHTARCCAQTPWEVAHQQLNFPHTIKDPCLQACHYKCIFGKTYFITATPSILPWLCSVFLLLVPIT